MTDIKEITQTIQNELDTDQSELESLERTEPPATKEDNSKEKDTDKLTTFKNIRGQLGRELNKIAQEAYDKAYKKALEHPDVALKLKRLADEVTAWEAGESKQDPHEELQRQKIETDCRAKAMKAKEKATPKKPLEVANFLKRFIYFVRIQPAGHNQKAPLYFYHPDNGVYIENEELLRDCIHTINPELTEKQASDVLYKISHSSVMKEIASDYTAFGNCLYNAKTEETQNFTPDIIVTRKIKTNYNKQATEPNISGWTFKTWLADLFDGDNELYRLAIQVIKASVTGSSLNNLFWLYGEGGTVKGTLQQLIINIVGLENIATLKINELHKSRFVTSQLLGKSVVIGDDVQAGADIKDTSVMFSLTTGDPITIEEKGKKPYSLTLNMTVIQSSNGFPNMVGDVQAIERRFRVLPFTSRFKGKPNKAIKHDYINRQEVLEYVVRLALETPTEDVNPQASQDALHDFQLDINPVLAFIADFFTDDLESEFLPNSFVWYVWLNYLEANNLTSIKKQNAFHREVGENLPEGFTKGGRTIPAGREHHLGFNPASDKPRYTKGHYDNNRYEPEKCKNPKYEKGYYHAKKK